MAIAATPFHVMYPVRSIAALLLLFLIAAQLPGQTLYVPSGTLGTSSNANVGIGTATPLGGLEVRSGDGVILGNQLYFWGSGLAPDGLPQSRLIENWGMRFSAPDSRWVMSVGTSLLVGYPADGVDRGSGNMFASGNLGLGTTSPISRLTIVANTPNTGGEGDPHGVAVYTGSNGQTLWMGYDGSADIGYINAAKSGSIQPIVLQSRGGVVGIGTTAPQNTLHVSGSGTGELTLLRLSNVHGDEASFDSVGIKLSIERNGYWAKGGIFFERTAGYGVGKMYFANNPNVDPSDVSKADARMTIDSSGNVGIGTTSPTHKLSVNGTIRTKEVIVDSGWSDYVFAPDYRLAPLSDVEQQIKSEGHLPGIPSAVDVAEHGVGVGEMQNKLLAKIEELTLHVIEQNKAIKSIEEENAALRRELRAAGVKLTQ